jgi:hypothetical protein
MKTAYARGGYKDALKGRIQFYRDRRRAGSFVAFWDEALLQVQLGNKDLALEALEKAYDEREDVTDLAVNPSWDSIRADPLSGPRAPHRPSGESRFRRRRALVVHTSSKANRP